MAGKGGGQIRWPWLTPGQLQLQVHFSPAALEEEDSISGTWGPKGSFFCHLKEICFLVWEWEPHAGYVSIDIEGRGTDLEHPNPLPNGALDVHAPHVLPVLLEQGHQEVDSHLNVLLDWLLLHQQVAHGDTHAEDLSQLELDCSFRLFYFAFQRFQVRNQSW